MGAIGSDQDGFGEIGSDQGGSRDEGFYGNRQELGDELYKFTKIFDLDNDC